MTTTIDFICNMVKADLEWVPQVKVEIDNKKGVTYTLCSENDCLFPIYFNTSPCFSASSTSSTSNNADVTPLLYHIDECCQECLQYSEYSGSHCTMTGHYSCTC